MEKKLGNRIQICLSSRGLTQKDLAVAVGVHPNVVSYWVRSTRTPNLDQVVAMASFFGVTTDYLFGLSEKEIPDLDLRALCIKTGLSEKSVSTLLSITANPEIGENVKAFDTMLSASKAFKNLITELSGLNDDCKQAQAFTEESNSVVSEMARNYQTAKVIDKMQLAFFKADEAFRKLVGVAFDYNRILDNLRDN